MSAFDRSVKYFDTSAWISSAVDVFRSIPRDRSYAECGSFSFEVARERGLCESKSDWLILTNRLLSEKHQNEFRIRSGSSHHWHLATNMKIRSAINAARKSMRGARRVLSLADVQRIAGATVSEIKGVIESMMMLGEFADGMFDSTEAFSFASQSHRASMVAGNFAPEYPLNALEGLYAPLGRELGTGAWGSVSTHALTHDTVWAARGVDVAIKIIPERHLKRMAETSDDAVVRKRFLREFEIGQRHDSGRLAKTYDVLRTNIRGYSTTPQPHYVLAMEYVKGSTLSVDVVEQFDLKRRFRVALDLAKAVGEFHEIGVHRDIKPANALLRENSEHDVVLVDYGIAKGVDDDTLTDTDANFSPLYASPQQLQSPLDSQRSDDVYSLGLSIAELLLAKKPFRDTRRHDLYRRKIAGGYHDDALKLLNMDAAALVLEMTLPDRAGRPKTAEVIGRLAEISAE